ncbi:Hypothetical predicted protein [Octopus vulgaris]|uniref:Uncharacterized protein n=1 Tax=Octopus vulgaris TaxID=6645 RepID=A0AA36AYC3_OCTVU|nr:Hypothetical predicted protein [Octopus vulgaris]
MPLHRNESSGQATLSVRNQDKRPSKKTTICRGNVSQCSARLRIFDFDGIEEKAAESDSEDEREPSGNLLEVSDPSGEIPMEVSHEPKHGRPNMTGSSVSLVGINSDDHVSKDALFLEKRQVLDENETSTLLLPYQRKLMSTVTEARRSVKKRVPKRRNLQKDSDEKS